jgi:AcrR family transcriptional regulator
MPVVKIEKEALLHACWDVFNKHGYHATSISMLAEATGLGKSGLLHHFNGKEGLMRAVLDYAKGQFASYVLAVTTEDLPVAQRLEKLLRRQNRLAKIERRGCFFANTAIEMGRDETFKDIIQSTFVEWQSVITDLMLHAYPESEARMRAYRLLLEYQGAVTFYKSTGDEAHLEDYVVRNVADFKSHLQLVESV